MHALAIATFRAPRAGHRPPGETCEDWEEPPLCRAEALHLAALFGLALAAARAVNLLALGLS